METGLEDFEDWLLEDRETRHTGYLILFVSGAISVALLYWLRASLEWAGLLALVAFFTAFSIDFTTAWHGEFDELRTAFLAAVLGTQFILTIVVALTLGYSSSDALQLGVANFFLVILPMGFEAGYFRARTVARVFYGLRVSGKVQKGSAVAVIPETARSFGPDVLEHRIELEIESAVESEDTSATYTAKEKTNLGFNIVKIGETRVLYRIENDVVETLFIPVDGIVARFEEADEPVNRLRFAMLKILHFAEPTPEQAESTRKALDRVFELFRAPTVDFKAFRKSVSEVWRIRRAGIATTLLVLAIGIVGLIAIVNVNKAVEFLSEPRVTNSLASLTYIVVIVGGMVALSKWIKGRGKKPPKQVSR